MDSKGFVCQVVIVVIIMTVSILSATSGVNKGVKFLSQLNIVIAVALMLFYPRFWPHCIFAGSFYHGHRM
jgi:choline/glycine/proline betaine transport protein